MHGGISGDTVLLRKSAQPLDRKAFVKTIKCRTLLEHQSIVLRFSVLDGSRTYTAKKTNAQPTYLRFCILL